MPKPTQTKEQFTARVKALFGDAIDCSKVVYINNHTPVILTCHIHGDFEKRPADVTQKKQGCQQCGRTGCGAYHKKDTKWFIEEATKVHGTKYDYSSVEYKSTHKKVTIICPEHGMFTQTPASHVYSKCGCNACSVKDYAGGYGVTRFENHPELKTAPGRLYLIKCTSETEQFIKIGITQKSVVDRFTIYNRLPYQFEVLHEQEGHLYDLFLMEQSIKKQFTKTKYRPSIKFHGHTECLNLDVATDVLTALSNSPNSAS